MVRKAAIPDTKKKSLFDSSASTEEKEGFYTASGRKITPSKPAAKKATTTPAPKKQIRDYPDLKMVSVTLYPRHQDRLEELLEHAKAKAREEGKREPGRSDLIRKAIEGLTQKDVENLTK